MHHTIVTIGREFGSGGHEIAELLAKNLGISCYNKELIEKAAQNSALDPKELESVDERPVSPFLYVDVREAEHIARYGQNLNDTLYQLQSRVIRQLAVEESCVIVGRCGNYVLREAPYCLHVFVYAPLEARIRRIMETERLSEEDARILVRKTDKARRSYYNYYTDLKWGEREHFNLLLDSSALGIQGCADLLKAAYHMLDAAPEREKIKHNP